MNDAALRATLIENAYAEVKNHYDWQRIAGEFDNLYHEILLSPRH
jgi:glycosyltransferase involved in cell wall biosynthesis